MPFPIPQIQLDLTEDTPTKVDVAELREELHAIGLTCSDTTLENLAKSKDEVLKRIPDGEYQGFQFYRNADSQQIAEHLKKGGALTSIDQVILLDEPLHAEWKPRGAVPMSDALYSVGRPEHFDYLQKNYLTFPGQVSSENYSNNETTVKAIKEIFVRIASNISSAVVTGLDKPLIEAALARILDLVPETVTDYDSGFKNRSILLVSGYDKTKGTAEGIGVINVEYHLIIKNYKEKKTQHNESSLSVTVRAATYDDPEELKAEILYLKTHFKGNMFIPNDIPVPESKVTVYDDLPPANSDTFIHSLPLEQTENDIIPVMVLFGPDLQDVGFIDNTDSKSTVTYSVSIISGFSASFGTKLAAGIVKSEISVNIEVSFTEQWNESHTETVSYSVPGGAKAYLYQGYFKCAVLKYNARTMEYLYEDTCTFNSNVIKTTENPIDSNAAVRYEQLKVTEEKALWEKIGGFLS